METNTTLAKLLGSTNVEKVLGSKEVKISEVFNNSHEVLPGGIFFAIRGANVDGHNYIDDAIARGAVAIVCQELTSTPKNNVCYIVVKNTSLALSQMVSAFYDNPSSKIKLIGVTGTSGKTTTVYLLYHIFTKLGFRVGMLSTIDNKISTDTTIKSSLTTPDAITLNKFLAKMVEQGCEYCFMEVSSHAVEQHRIAGINFAGAVFMNISHDHLDYHKTFTNYINAKKGLFDKLSAKSFALTNTDDTHAAIIVQNTLAVKRTFGLKSSANFSARIISNTMEGLELSIDGKEVWVPLVGEFNAYNVLAAYGVSCLLKQDKLEVLMSLSTMTQVPGRFQCIQAKDGFTIVVDYAHKPDALQKLLSTIRKVKNPGAKLILVLGCGGDRDRAKRPIMGDIACENSEVTIFTSDNPRYESAQSIIDQMKSGVDQVGLNKVISIIDRHEAIKTAYTLASTRDVIVIAGKGHETYQEINGQKILFDDSQIVQQLITTTNSQNSSHKSPY